LDAAGTVVDRVAMTTTTSTTITRDELQALIAAGDAVVVETLGPQHFADATSPARSTSRTPRSPGWPPRSCPIATRRS
jgi:hypothetical protein